MKRLLTPVIPALLIILLSQCKTETSPTYNSYFWTTSGPDTIHYLFIDGTNAGILPYLPQAPTCDEGIEKALHYPLKPGKYNLEMKDKLGAVKYAETLTLLDKKEKSGNFGKTFPLKQGGSGLSNSKDCLIEELHYR